MVPVLLVVALALGPAVAPVEGGRRVPDVIAGFTFVAGSASLHTPGQPLQIRTGDTVVWTNLDPISHDVTFDAIDFAAYLDEPGSSAELTFSTPGHFTYRCVQHPDFPGMQGLVFVSNSAP